jgi:hypothetical protein
MVSVKWTGAEVPLMYATKAAREAAGLVSQIHAKSSTIQAPALNIRASMESNFRRKFLRRQ